MASRFLARQIRSKLLPLAKAPAMVTFTFDDVPASACDVRREHPRASTAPAGLSMLPARLRHRELRAARSGVDRSAADDLGERARDRMPHLFASGVSHMNFDELGLELDRNQSALKQIDSTISWCGISPIPTATFPSARNAILKAVSIRAVRGIGGINRGSADLGPLDAWPLENASLDRAKIAELIAETARTGGWLIFYSHDVADKPSRYGVSPDLLEWAVTRQANGSVLATVAAPLSSLPTDCRNNPSSPNAGGAPADGA